MQEDTFEWPHVTVLVCTYDRPDEITATLAALFTFLQYPPEKLRWHIADDGTGGDYLDFVSVWLRALWSHDDDPHITMTETKRRGWGANVNTALRAIQTDYVFFTEDDYVLLRNLDLKPYVAAMEFHPWIGMTRLGIAGHEFRLRNHELNIASLCPDFRDGAGAGSAGGGMINMFEILNEPGGAYSFYRYSHRPHLKHRRFHEAYGLYPEGLGLAETEHGFCDTVGNLSGPAIVCPMGWSQWWFSHIGLSRQGGEQDVNSNER